MLQKIYENNIGKRLNGFSDISEILKIPLYALEKSDFCLHRCVDANMHDDVAGRKSTNGFVYTLGGTTIC